MVPARRDGLQDETAFLEMGGVRALPDFIGGETVTICGERLDYWFKGVGGGDPGRGVDVVF